MTPHMHVRGKDMTYIAHYPDGRDETLLSVPKYDFNWQITYELVGAEAAAEGHPASRSSRTSTTRPNNKFNPDPTQAVRWGDQTWEEMMIGFLRHASRSAEGNRLDRRAAVANRPDPIRQNAGALRLRRFFVRNSDAGARMF